jgi:hypothetical protein
MASRRSSDSSSLALAECDLDRATGGILVRRGKGDQAREAGMDRWGWQQIELWLDYRAVEVAREGVPLTVVQRQLGHANLGITSIHLQGIDNSDIINTVHARPAPTLPASAGLR